MMKKIFILICCCAALLCLLPGCGHSSGRDTAYSEEKNKAREGEGSAASRDIFAMDTFMTVTCYGERCKEALNAAEEEIRRLDELLSVGNENSEISKLNKEGNAVLSEDSAVMIETALDVNNRTNGCFDITIYPLMELWGFTAQELRIPSEKEIRSTLENVGSNLLIFDRKSGKVSLSEDHDGMGIDLGGIAKGYCSDRLMQIFADYDLTAGLVSLGGNVQCYGEKPDGSLWRCGIRNPFDPDNADDLAGVVSVHDCAVITSGAYERFFTGEDGKTYHHILDPHTGYPANTGLASVTIVSQSGILADALSTAVYVLGLEKAKELWMAYADEFDMILVTDEGKVYITEPLQGSFTTSMPLSIITRE